LVGGFFDDFTGGFAGAVAGARVVQPDQRQVTTSERTSIFGFSPCESRI
jgi:hypothetical protein